MNCLKKPYFVTMGMFQMGVLLAFNSSPTQPFSDILTYTKLHSGDLVKQAQSLVDAKLLTTEVNKDDTTCNILKMSEQSSWGIYMFWASIRPGRYLTNHFIVFVKIYISLPYHGGLDPANFQKIQNGQLTAMGQLQYNFNFAWQE